MDKTIALALGITLGVCGMGLYGSEPTPRETDTGSEYELIGNNIQRTVDLEMGNVCYKDAYRNTLSCVKI